MITGRVSSVSAALTASLGSVSRWLRAQAATLRSWLLRCAHWVFVEAWQACLTAALFALLMVIPQFRPHETWFRFDGLALQLIGIGAVVWQVRDARMHLRGRGLFAPLMTWLKRWPKYRPSIIVTISANLAGGSAVMTGGRAVLSVTPSNLEDQVRAIESELAKLRGRLTSLERGNAPVIKQLSDAVQQEQRDRTAADSLGRSILEAIQLGSIHYALPGVVFLAAGVVMSTAYPELAEFPRWVGIPLLVAGCVLCFLVAHKDEATGKG